MSATLRTGPGVPRPPTRGATVGPVGPVGRGRESVDVGRLEVVRQRLAPPDACARPGTTLWGVVGGDGVDPEG